MKGNKIVYIVRPEVKVTEIEGYETLIFHNQIEGLKSIKENPFIIVIDLGLHGITGLDLISMIRANPSNHHIKIIICSKKYNHNLIKKCFQGGADFYISIPFDANEIKFIINDINEYIRKFILEKQEHISFTPQKQIISELSDQHPF